MKSLYKLSAISTTLLIISVFSGCGSNGDDSAPPAAATVTIGDVTFDASSADISDNPAYALIGTQNYGGYGKYKNITVSVVNSQEKSRGVLCMKESLRAKDATGDFDEIVYWRAKAINGNFYLLKDDLTEYTPVVMDSPATSSLNVGASWKYFEGTGREAIIVVLSKNSTSPHNGMISCTLLKETDTKGTSRTIDDEIEYRWYKVGYGLVETGDSDTTPTNGFYLKPVVN